MKKRVLLLGAAGMLGSAVYNALKDKYRLQLAAREFNGLRLLDRTYGGVGNHSYLMFDAAVLMHDYRAKSQEYAKALLAAVGEVDYVINAIGITIPHALDRIDETFFINGALPHILTKLFGPRVIHITTDCVYDGKTGYPYDELSAKSPVDIYGLSKSLGEPANCITLRTSIIGPELRGYTGLLGWFLQQEGKTVKGFTNHFWNGVTTHQFGLICDQIMSSHVEKGLYHVFSNPVSKYEMLLAFRERFGVKCQIDAFESTPINRTLDTLQSFNHYLHNPSFHEMLNQIPWNR